MRKLWVAIRNWATLPGIADEIMRPEPFISIEQGIEDYFTTTDPIVVMAAYAQVRAILVGRKLLKRERSDKGSKRVGKLGMSSDARLIEPAVNGGETA